MRPLVLYADDEANNRIVFAQSFGNQFDVITVPDGAAALALLETREAAVLVTDMRMEGLSGEELLRIAKDRHPRTIRIVVTAYSDIDRILRALNEGLVARYIIKPWEHAEITQVLRWACEAWSLSTNAAALHNRLAETERLVASASSFVHDVKSPIMSLLANTDHLHELAGDVPALRAALAAVPLADEHRRALAFILDELLPISEEMQTSTRRIQELVETVAARPAPAPIIDPLQIVRHVMAVCQPLAAQLSASLDYEGPGALPRIRMSASELSEVLINLVANGAQAVGARGTTGHVSITAHLLDGMLELQVRDDGVGIPAAAMSRVGTPFYTTRIGGMGLGVAQCQRLVAIAGGRFSIDSQPGVGTIATISIPTAA
ncbi:MAG TPA: hybrid sensor histidine kinase/response regulator [Kofleriaceae bacterium]|nr:hybrid sensor histidine kinase/response regulator [Kofleriaceae bacterium]